MAEDIPTLQKLIAALDRIQISEFGPSTWIVQLEHACDEYFLAAHNAGERKAVADRIVLHCNEFTAARSKAKKARLRMTIRGNVDMLKIQAGNRLNFLQSGT
jgi:hypothetical protein